MADAAKLLADLRQVADELESNNLEWNEIVVRKAIAQLERLTPRPMTLASWMADGPFLVREGVSTAFIVDRWPTYVVDRITREGAYGWQYGWRWQDDEAECSRWTLPEEIHSHLPPSPYKLVTSGAMKRWPTIKDAQAALAAAAFDWAEKEAARG